VLAQGRTEVTIKMKKNVSFLIRMFILSVVFAPVISLAYTTQIYPQVDIFGNVTGTFSAPNSNCSNKHVTGNDFPNGSNVATYAGISCGTATSTFSGFLEGGWNNGAGNTPELTSRTSLPTLSKPSPPDAK